MSQPAGVQIRRWFAFLVGLLLVVNLLALTGGLVVSRSVRAVVEEAEPLATATAAIQREILGAKSELFQYLAQFSDSPDGALVHLDAVSKTLGQMRAISHSKETDAEVERMQQSTNQYRKVLELLPRTTQGSRDWSRIQEYSNTAVTLGKDVEGLAKGLSDTAQKEIRERSTSMARGATTALWLSVAAILASLGSLAALHHWWKRFQELILGM
jgi:hypothetical protein